MRKPGTVSVGFALAALMVAGCASGDGKPSDSKDSVSWAAP